MKIDRGGNGRNGDGTWPATDGRGCPLCGAIRNGGHGGGCPKNGTSYHEDGTVIIRQRGGPWVRCRHDDDPAGYDDYY